MRWIVLALVVAAIAADLLAGITGSSLTFLAGFGLVYAGERLFAEEGLRWVFTGGGIGVVALALALRARSYASSTGSRREAQRLALLFAGIGAASLGLYGLSSDTVVAALGLADDTADRWQVAWQALFPIALLIGAVPMFLLDRVLSNHPVTLPMGAARRAIESGLVVALGTSLVFPLNYIANEHKVEWDYAYFRVTDPGTSTLALAKTLSEPIEATLFFSPGNDVGREIRPYFDAVEKASEGRFTFAYVDQAMEPKLAEELKVRENGFVVFKKGDAVEKFKVGTDLDKARRDLKKLDQTVQKHLLKVARGARTAYFLVGHGEASSKEKDEPLRKLNLLKTALEGQNYKVKNFGVAEGSTDAVPEDAAFVLVAAPEKPLLPEEEAALTAYLDKGGRLFVLVEPGLEPLNGLLGALGLQAGTAPLAHMTKIITQTRGPADRVFLGSNRFGSHAAVTTLSKNSAQLYVLMPTVAALTEIPGGKGKPATLVRTYEETWADADGDRARGDAEKADVYTVAYAVSGNQDVAPGTPIPPEFRAVVLGDVSMLSDPVLQASQGNQQLALDTIRWLAGDEDISGTVENEEDVKIEHTREQDVAWFYGTVFAVPAFVLAIGIVLTTMRQRRSR